MFINNNSLNKNNKVKIIFLTIFVVIIIILFLFLIFYKKTEYYLTLNGNADMILYLGEEYVEPGYKAYDSKGKTYYDDVIVSGSVNSTLTGEYEITYSFNDLVQVRTITIIPNNYSSTIFGLNGESIMFIPIGGSFSDPGFYVIDSKRSDLKDYVKVEGEVDVNKAGSYTITYSLDDNGTKYSKQRIVIVTSADFDIDYEPKVVTNNEVKIYGYVSSNYFDYVIFPDGNKDYNRNFSYSVKDNNTYKIMVYLKDGTFSEKEIVVNNIDKNKPTGSCNASIYNNSVKVNVDAKDDNGIYGYSYNFDEQMTSYVGNNTYSYDKSASKISVNIKDKAGNVSLVTCSINKLEDYFNQDLHHKNINYVLYYPGNLDLTSKNPLVVYLHGSDGCGTRTKDMFSNSSIFINNMKNHKYKDAIYVAPQCSCDNLLWTYDCFYDVKSMLDLVVKQYNVDTKKISITGHSAGGYGVYRMVALYPKYFSAGVVASGINTENEEKFKTTQMRHYHGTEDTVLNYDIARQRALNINRVTGKMKFIPLKGEGHAIQSTVYNNLDIINWMISQTKE